jgi:hypothetical protein
VINPELAQKWGVKANGCKLVNVTFTTQREMYPHSPYNQYATPQEEVKYLGLHLDRRLTWHKRKQLGITRTKMYWSLGRKSELSTSKKRLINKTILKPFSICGIQLWGTASTFNIKILERFQSNALHLIVDALGMCQIRLSEGISKRQQLKKKSTAAALNTELASAHTQTT